MSENENIEARLCSYVEGDLDAEGRAEIEKYLLTHPQYRVLIEELSRTRGLLRGLPREAAPAELLETLSGQIERSALLGDDDPGSMQIRPNRFGHLAAWAAVLLLSAGLAAVVYRVLPTNKTQPEIALLKPAPAPISATQATLDEPARVADADKSLAMKDTDTVKDTVKEIGKDNGNGGAPIGETTAINAAAAAVPAAAAPATAPGNDQLETAAATPALQAPAESAGAASSAVAVVSGGAGATVVADGTTVTNAASPSQPNGSIVGGEATQTGQNMYLTLRATDAKAADARVTQYLNTNGIQYDSGGMGARTRLSAGPLQPLTFNGIASETDSIHGTPSTGNFTFARAKLPNSMAGADKDEMRRFSASAPAFIGMANSTTQIAGNIIIARDLTADQARRLASDLGVSALPAEVNLQPTTQPLTLNTADDLSGESPLQAGQNVRIIAREKLLPDVDAMNETQTIDPGGNLTLPLVGKIQAAGLTGAQLAEKIPQAYRDAKSPTDATWVIDRVATASTTAPTTAAMITAALTSAASGNLALTPAAATTGPFASSAPSGIGGEGSDHQVLNVTIEVVGPAVPATTPSGAPIATGAPMPGESITGAAASEAAPPPIPEAAQPPVAAPPATMPTTRPVQ